MLSPLLRALVGACLFVSLSVAGPHSDPASAYQRIICVVPMIGAGTLEDPKRPMFTPVVGAAPSQDVTTSKGFSDPAVIVAYHSVLSDDGNSAIVEFVARDRAAFRAIFAAKRQNQVEIFERINNQRADVLAELRKIKRTFDFSMLRVGAL